jgi:hypothetical protein
VVELLGEEDREELQLGAEVAGRGFGGRRGFYSRSRRGRMSARPSVGLVMMLGFSRCRLAVHEVECRKTAGRCTSCRFGSGKWRCVALAMRCDGMDPVVWRDSADAKWLPRHFWPVPQSFLCSSSGDRRPTDRLFQDQAHKAQVCTRVALPGSTLKVEMVQRPRPKALKVRAVDQQPQQTLWRPSNGRFLPAPVTDCTWVSATGCTFG